MELTALSVVPAQPAVPSRCRQTLHASFQGHAPSNHLRTRPPPDLTSDQVPELKRELAVLVGGAAA